MCRILNDLSAVVDIAFACTLHEQTFEQQTSLCFAFFLSDGWSEKGFSFRGSQLL